ncbi:hypothetical protein N7495_000927 [Penicillium taxi]|uniref:uncharacterized protein n=1 Tax=Penicillium taxi TaxID=168475 RepID=UPI002545158F|nr:uncharacterized protein N7495_000927 [Penicillium taxi]KAJ5908245.1 hypothetical protein N7495_000927 [Penicillium taxi]
MSQMSSHLPHSTLHSDETQGPPDFTTPSIPHNRFHSLPSHRRSNTEYIARPPIFEEDVHDLDPTSSRIIPSWTDTFPKKKFEARARILSDWFQGKSDPVTLGSSNMRPSSAANGEMDPAHVNTASMGHSRQISVPIAGRFSFFGLRKQQLPVLPEPADDEFLNLDILAALSLPSSDGANEEDLDTLREQATTVLQQMQEAYRQRTFAMHQALADRNEKRDELEETRARVNHLKIQLDTMAAKVLDQEKAMQAMADDLEQERLLRQQQEETRGRSGTMRAHASDDDVHSLVLQTPHRAAKRSSHGTFTSDSGFESGDESVAESIFSREDSICSPTSILTTPSLSQVTLSSSSASTPTIHKSIATVTNSPTPTRPSAYDRVIKGIASTRLGSSLVAANQNQCNNCHGVPASEAWSVMGILKDENRGLKNRIGELELVVDDCLSLVG